MDFSPAIGLAGSAPNEGHFDATLGLYVTPELFVLAQSFNTISGASSTAEQPAMGAGQGAVEPVYRLNAEWRVQGGGFVTLAGQNAYRENGLLLALWRQF